MKNWAINSRISLKRARLTILAHAHTRYVSDVYVTFLLKVECEYRNVNIWINIFGVIFIQYNFFPIGGSVLDFLKSELF